MATQTVQFAFLTGQTVTVKLFADDGSDTVLATPSATEATNRTGVYSFTQTDRAAGTYLITVSATGINAAYTVQLTLATATFWAHERTHANVTQFGGTNGTFSSGRPEVNTTHLAGQTVTAASGVTFPSSLASPTNITAATGITVSTNNDKTGYMLTQSFPTNFSDLVINASGHVVVQDSSLTAAKFATDSITSTAIAASAVSEIQSGLATSTALADVAASVASLPSAVEIADQVYEDLPADHTTPGTFGKLFADISAKTTNLPADPADASDIAASFSTVNTKLDTIAGYVDTEIASMKVVTDKLGGMLVQDGLVYQFTANALELAPSAGGGSTTVVVHPGYASRPEKVAGTTITLYHEETGTVGPVRVQTRSNDTYTDVNLNGYTGLHVVIKDYEMVEIDDISTVTVSGTGNSQFSFPVTTTVTGTVTADTQEEWHYYSLRDADGVVICTGRLRVREG